MLAAELLLAAAWIAGAAADDPGKWAPHIVGGSPIAIERVPWQVSLTGRYGSHNCGGSIVQKSSVVTASHCIHTEAVEYMTVRAGTSVLSGGIVYGVASAKKHELFSSEPVDYDVAVVIIRGEFPLETTIQAVPLATTRPKPGSPVVVSGWGATQAKHHELMAVTVHTISRESCQAVYDNLGMLITERMLCTLNPGAAQGPYFGDSGGPLMQHGRLVGLVSWGNGYAEPDFPAVYTDVVALRGWIIQHAGIGTQPEEAVYE